jgi:F0F1-type ATP synthase assembly protein I
MKENKPSNLYLSLLNMGWVIALTMTVFVLGGHWLDERFGTPPLFLLIGVLFGFVSCGYWIFRTIQKIDREDSRKP